MQKNTIQCWILEFREILRENKNCTYLLDSWTQFTSAISVIKILSQQESFLKLLDSRSSSILVSRLTRNRYFTIKTLLLFVVAILLCRITNRRMIENKKIFLTGLLPMQINSIGYGNDIVEDSHDSFNIVPLLPGRKEKNISDRSFFSDIWSELNMDLNLTDQSDQDKKEKDGSFVLWRQLEKKEIANIVKIIMYLQKNVAIHSISSDGGHDRNVGDGYLFYRDFHSQDRFQEMANIFNLSLTKPNLVYPTGFCFSIGLSEPESKKKTFLIIPRLSYEANESFYPTIIKKWVRTSCGNDFQDNRFNRNLKSVIQWYKKYMLTHQPIRKHTINQRFSNLKKTQNKCFDRLIFIYRTERFVNKDPNASKYKWSKGSKNFEEQLAVFISEQNRRFQRVFHQVPIIAYSIEQNSRCFQRVFHELYRIYSIEQNKNSRFQRVFHKLRMIYSIDWLEVLDKKDFYQSVCFFLSKLIPFFFHSLRFFFVSFGSMPVYRSQIHMDEVKHMNDALENQLLESIGLQKVHLKKRKTLVLDDYYTSQKSKFLINEGTIFPFIFKNKIPNHDNWMNPVKSFHRSCSLISSFLKVNRLQFLNNQYNFSSNKKFSFYGERSFNFDLMYEQFLNILFIRNKRFSFCGGKKTHACLDRDPFFPSELEVSNIFIPKNFPKSGDDRYDLYKCFPFTPHVPRSIYSIGDISGTPLTEEEIENLERTYGQPVFPINLSDSKKKNLHQYLDFNSNMDLLDTLLEKRKKPLKKFLQKGQMSRKFQTKKKTVFSIFSKLKQSGPYIIPLFLTRTGHKYIKFLFLDTLSDLFAILRKSPKVKKFLSIYLNIRHGSKVIFIKKLWGFIWKKLSLSQQNRITEISSKCLHSNILWMAEYFSHTNNESPAHLRSLNMEELLFSILLFILLTGYLVHTHLYFVSRFSKEVEIEFQQVKSLMIPSYLIELRKLLDRYPTSEQNSFWFEDLFRVAREQLGNFLEEGRGSLSGGDIPRGGGFASGGKSIRSKKKGLNLMDLISLLPNPINRIEFLRKTRHFSHTSKAIYSLIRKRKNMNSEWIDDKIESWISNSDFIADKEREFLVQFTTLTTETEKRLDQILVTLTNNDQLSKNNSGYTMIEQPGTIYLKSIVDIQKKELLNYEVNTSCLAERRVFLAHYQTLTYSEIPSGASFLDNRKPFSLRLALSPPRGILLIGSIGTGRSYLLKSLGTTSYVPFITVFVNKFLENFPKGFDFDDSEEDLFDEREGTIYSLLPDNEGSCYNSENYEGDDSNHLDRNLDSKLKFLSMEDPVSSDIMEIDRFYLMLQFELAKAMAPCVIWIPNIHDLDRNESNDLSLGILVNSLSSDSENGSPNNILVIASTHIPKKVDPALIAPNKLGICIKLRRLLISQQRKHFFTLSYNRGFHLEKKIFDTNGLGSITLGSNVGDLVALTNEALSISIIQKKSILDTNIIRSALHRQTWDFRSQIRAIQDHGILVYQIGRAVSQNLLLSNCSIDPISIYMKKKSCKEGDSFLYSWYFELGTSMKKLTIFLYLLSCSAGSVAQDLWSLPGAPNKKNDGITSYRLLENESDLVHGLLEIEGALLGPSQTGTRFDNDRVPLLLRPEPKNPLKMIQKGSSSIVDHRFSYEKYESGFEEGETVFDPQPLELEEDLFNNILWAPRLWRPWGFLFDEGSDDLRYPYWEGSFQDKHIIDDDDYDEEGELQENDNDSQFLQDGILQDQTRAIFSNEQGFFRISQFIWDPADPLFLLFQEDPFVPLFAHQEFSPDEQMSNILLTSQTKKIYWKYLNKRWFRKNLREQNFKLLIDRERWLRTQSSVSNEFFRSNTLYESYKYLSNLFLSNETLLAQITKTLVIKKWVFPDEIVVTICNNNEQLV